jgi:hypothetical protein
VAKAVEVLWRQAGLTRGVSLGSDSAALTDQRHALLTAGAPR